MYPALYSARCHSRTDGEMPLRESMYPDSHARRARRYSACSGESLKSTSRSFAGQVTTALPTAQLEDLVKLVRLVAEQGRVEENPPRVEVCNVFPCLPDAAVD